MRKLLPICFFLVIIFFFFTSPVFAQQGGAGVNIGPIRPESRPSVSDLQTLGASWVRFVYAPDEAAENNFDYDSYINELNQAGIDVILVLNQQTLWPPNLQVNANYVNDFANMASQTAAHFGNNVAAYEIWNEQDAQNNVASIYIPPQNYASLLAAAYNAIKEANPSSFVVTGGMVAGDPNYLARVIEAAGGLPADGVGVHPYTLDLEAVRQTLLNFLAVSEGRPLWITEFGWETLNQQDQANYLRAVYELVAAQFGDQVATTLWYCFSDHSSLGFGLVDLLGNPKLAFEYFQLYAAMLESIIPFFKFIPFDVPPPLPSVSFPSLTCEAEIGGSLDSRPRPCDACNLADNFCTSCATTFTVHDSVQYKRGDGTAEEPYCVEKEWFGLVSIDPSNTTIPFVGYKGEGVKDKSDYEQKYLADYFEGTNEYYQNYEQYWLDWINHAGVVRKLTPMEYQNQLKKEMVGRAEETIAKNIHEGGIHDYNLNYIGRLCWDAPFWLEALTEIADRLFPPGLPFEKIRNLSNYCVFEDPTKHPEQFALIQIYKNIPFFNLPFVDDHYTQGAKGKITDLAGHFPPDPSEEDYPEKWLEWKESDGGKWYKLWAIAPMMSREDTPGNISPYLGYKSKDSFQIINPDALIEELPHVARLYEATQEVNKMLIPFWDESLKFAQKQTGPIIASAKEPVKVLGEKKLLAQACPRTCPIEIQLNNVPPPSPGEYNFTSSYCVPCDVCDGISHLKNLRITDSGGGAGYEADHVLEVQCPHYNDTSWGTGYSAGRVKMDVGSSFTVSVGYEKATSVGPGCCVDGGSGSCTITLLQNDEGGYEWDITCGAAEFPEGVCGINGPLSVPGCEMPAITDPNDNDDICGKQILINLNAKDAFENWEKPKCEAEGYKCTPVGCVEGTPGCVCKDPCDEIITKSVSRKVGIFLNHPYLTKIWEQTGKSDVLGLFNVFRPAGIPKFREIDAASEITYDYLDMSHPLGGGVSPGTGRFYYNYLGGVQLTKEWVVDALMPQKDDKSLSEWLFGR